MGRDTPFFKEDNARLKSNSSPLEKPVRMAQPGGGDYRGIVSIINISINHEQTDMTYYP